MVIKNLNSDFIKQIDVKDDKMVASLDSSKIIIAAGTNLLDINIGEPVYKIHWAPWSDHEGTNYFGVSAKDRPLKLCSKEKEISNFVSFEENEEISKILDFTFNSTGQLIYCTTKKGVKVFDIEKVDSDLIETNIKSLSSIGCRRDDSELLCVGNFSGRLELLDGRNKASITELQDESKSAIHQISFTSDSWHFLTCSRKSSKIHKWDLRKFEIVHSYERGLIDSNQRFYFDVKDDIVATGNSLGEIYLHKGEDLPKRIHCAPGPTPSVAFYKEGIVFGVGDRDHSNSVIDWCADV